MPRFSRSMTSQSSVPWYQSLERDARLQLLRGVRLGALLIKLQHGDAQRRREIPAHAAAVDLGYEMRQGLTPQGRHFFEAIPEFVFEADAGIAIRHTDGPFGNFSADL